MTTTRGILSGFRIDSDELTSIDGILMKDGGTYQFRLGEKLREGVKQYDVMNEAEFTKNQQTSTAGEYKMEVIKSEFENGEHYQAVKIRNSDDNCLARLNYLTEEELTTAKKVRICCQRTPGVDGEDEYSLYYQGSAGINEEALDDVTNAEAYTILESISNDVMEEIAKMTAIVTEQQAMGI